MSVCVVFFKEIMMLMPEMFTGRHSYCELGWGLLILIYLLRCTQPDGCQLCMDEGVSPENLRPTNTMYKCIVIRPETRAGD